MLAVKIASMSLTTEEPFLEFSGEPFGHLTPFLKNPFLFEPHFLFLCFTVGRRFVIVGFKIFPSVALA